MKLKVKALCGNSSSYSAGRVILHGKNGETKELYGKIGGYEYTKEPYIVDLDWQIDHVERVDGSFIDYNVEIPLIVENEEKDALFTSQFCPSVGGYCRRDCVNFVPSALYKDLYEKVHGETTRCRNWRS